MEPFRSERTLADLATVDGLFGNMRVTSGAVVNAAEE